MSRIDFYHLQRQTLDEVLPLLLAKAYQTGKRIMVKVGTPERVDFLNNTLWTYDDEAFLPHGSAKDGFADQQPIWLTAEATNANQAEFLFLVDGAEASTGEIAAFARIFNIFDGNSAEALAQARRLWKEYKAAGHEVYYWQQSARGAWENKA